MPLALCCMSHSPMLNIPGPPAELVDDVEAAVRDARGFVDSYDPELVVIFSPDHYNGFFYRLMPAFCIGTAARGVGDYGSYGGDLDVPADVATALAAHVLAAGVDVATAAAMEVDHGTMQPLEKLFGDATAVPVIPVFINSVATPLGPLSRSRALGAAVGEFLAGLDRRVLLIGSGGLSHDPPIPDRDTAPPPVLERIVGGRPMTADQRAARQQAVAAAAREFAAGDAARKPLNPEWDTALLELFDTARLAELDRWSNTWITEQAGNSAHEIRTWLAAFAALATQGPYRTASHYYRAAPDLIAGFAVRTAVPVGAAA